MIKMTQKSAMLTMGMLLFFVMINPLRAEILGQTASDFTLKSAKGNNLKLSEHRGEVIVLNFWASWCGPCRKEMPILDGLYEQYKDLGMTVWGVNVEKNSADAKKMLRNIPVDFPILFDIDNKVSEAYDIVAMPSTFIIDRDGIVRYQHFGYLPGYELEYDKQVRELVRE